MILSCELIEIQPCSLSSEEDQQQEERSQEDKRLSLKKKNMFNHLIENSFVPFSNDMDKNSIKKLLPCFINQANFCVKSTSLDVYTDMTSRTGGFILWFIKTIKKK